MNMVSSFIILKKIYMQPVCPGPILPACLLLGAYALKFFINVRVIPVNVLFVHTMSLFGIPSCNFPKKILSATEVSI